MTHEELLAKLWILPADVTELQHGAKAVQALRVVVELHKPADSRGDVVCANCPTQNYPCATIQVLEKELQ